MREAAQQEKGIFWCLSFSPRGLQRGGTYLIRTILQRLESGSARATQVSLNRDFIPGSELRNKMFKMEFEARKHLHASAQHVH